MSKMDLSVIEQLIRRDDDEDAAAYGVFCKYAILLPTERRFDRAAPILVSETGFSASEIADMFERFHWTDRVTKIDNYLLRLDIEQRREESQKYNLRYIEANRKLKDDALAARTKAMSVTNTLLGYADLIGKEEPVEYVTTEDGREVPVIVNVEMKAKISDIPQMVKAMSLLTNIINDMPTEIVNNQPVSHKEIDKMDLTELDQTLEEIEKELAEYDAGMIN